MSLRIKNLDTARNQYQQTTLIFYVNQDAECDNICELTVTHTYTLTYTDTHAKVVQETHEKSYKVIICILMIIIVVH